MGLDRTIVFPNERTPEWEAIRAQLAAVSETAAIRMIDGLPAFPDEVPAPDWKELRLGLGQGMVTLRRLPGRLNCVIWGNADTALQQAWNTLAWACARAGGGLIETPSGQVSPEVFADENSMKTG